MKKIWIFFVAFIFIFTNKSNIFAEELPAPLDIVIVLDSSGSMKSNDNERIVIEAAKMLVDMLNINGSRIGVVSFANYVKTVVDLKEITSKEDKKEIKEMIESINYAGATYLNDGLEEGNKLLHRDGKLGSNPIMIFFTDGNNSPSWNDMESDVKEMDEQTKELAKNIGIMYPIYTIALDMGDSAEDRPNNELLEYISSVTHGRHMSTGNVNEIPQFFYTIFAELIESRLIKPDIKKESGLIEVEINIPNTSVYEANLIITSNSPLSDIRLIDPNGEVFPVEHYYHSVEKKYSLVKLEQPASGIWRMQTNDKNENIDASLIFNYNYRLEARFPEQREFEIGDTVSVQGYLYNNAEVIDNQLHEDFESLLIVETENDIKEIKGEIEGENESKYFSFSYKPEKEGIETLHVYVSGAGFYRYSENIQINVLEGTVPPSGSVPPKGGSAKGGPDDMTSTIIAFISVLLVLLLAIAAWRFITKRKPAEDRDIVAYLSGLLWYKLDDHEYNNKLSNVVSLYTKKSGSTLEEIITKRGVHNLEALDTIQLLSRENNDLGIHYNKNYFTIKIDEDIKDEDFIMKYDQTAVIISKNTVTSEKHITWIYITYKQCRNGD